MPKGNIKRFILEAESAPAEHHIIRCVYQYRIGRSHTIADRKGDKAAVDLHRILQLLFKHLLDECADIKLGQLGVAGPEGSRRHYACDTAIIGRKRLADLLSIPLQLSSRPQCTACARFNSLPTA